MLAIIIILLAGAATAEDQKPPMDLLTYPGAEVTMEVNLSAEDIAPMIQATMPMMGDTGQILSPEDLNDILKDLKQIEILQLDVRRSKTKVQDIATYYSSKLPDGKWSRVLYRSDSKSSLAIYADAEAKSYYGFSIRNASPAGKPIKQVTMAKIVGKIDFQKLAQLATKAVIAFSQPQCGL